jgi:hypothetical protein
VQEVTGAPAGSIDGRSDRFAQGAVGILLLAGFVFRIPWLVPIVAILLAAGAALGPQANLLQVAFARLVLPRLPPGDTWVEARTARDQDMLLAALCVLASLMFLVFTPAGWLVAIVAAVVAIVAATAGIHVADQVRARFFR